MAFQTTSGSARERWVAAFLPAVATILIAFTYFFFYLNPAIQAVESDFETTKSEAVIPRVVKELNDELEQLQDDQTELEKTINSADDETVVKSAAFEQLSSTAKHRAVTALFQEFDIAILEDQKVQQINLPSLSSESVKVLKSSINKEAANFRNLTLTADYNTIVTLLRKLPEIQGVLPIAITLEKAKASKKLNDLEKQSAVWTITLLM